MNAHQWGGKVLRMKNFDYQIDYEALGLKLKKLRKKQGITQEQVADGLNSTVSFVSNIENNHSKINLKVLAYYSKMLNLSMDYLLNGSDSEPASTRLDQELINLIQALSDTDKEKLIRILKIWME